jgi:hypothetical protein
MVTILIIRQITLKQSLIFPGEWPPDKNIHRVLNNVLLMYINNI